VVASKDAVDAAELLGQREGALGLGAVGEEAAGLPPRPGAPRAGHRMVAHEVAAQQQRGVAEGLRPTSLGEQPLAGADPFAEHAEPEGPPAVWRLLVVHASNNTVPAGSVSFSGRRG
jgi:hypothetical protein